MNEQGLAAYESILLSCTLLSLLSKSRRSTSIARGHADLLNLSMLTAHTSSTKPIMQLFPRVKHAFVPRAAPSLVQVALGKLIDLSLGQRGSSPEEAKLLPSFLPRELHARNGLGRGISVRSLLLPLATRGKPGSQIMGGTSWLACPMLAAGKCSLKLFLPSNCVGVSHSDLMSLTWVIFE